jgi:SP family sugar:H+ symporter-like MFS transporter
MYQSECAPKEIRGAVVASYQLMITIGILVSNLINYGVRNIQESDASWRIVIGLGIAFSLPLGFGVLFLPESPRWLAGRHDWDGARLSLARLRGLKDDAHGELVNADITEMYAILEEQRRAGTGTWMECFQKNTGTTPKVLYRTLLGITIHFGQQWTGSKSTYISGIPNTDA